ncbi:MAG: HNH endonuclease [Elusimicrobia bacterium]|nr:HNH endonuclease [Elusimicrobiota bacterium]
MVPISAERVRIGFDAALAVRSLIDRARQVLRHKYPEGRLEDVVKEALEVLLDRKDPQRRLGFKPAPVVRDAAPGEPRFLRALRAGRYVPARVKREVWRRDDGRCAWRFEDGTLCGSRDGLEYDHVRPYARGGRSDDARNVRLLCRAHNRLAAERAGLTLVSGRAAGSA